MNASPRLFSAFIKKILPKEQHPFFIFPKSQLAEPVHLPFYVKRFKATATAFVPVVGIVLGWPFAAKYLTTKTGGP